MASLCARDDGTALRFQNNIDTDHLPLCQVEKRRLGEDCSHGSDYGVESTSN